MIAIALFSPIGHISEELVIAHMGEHLLIGDIATLLLVLGLTRSLLQPVLAIRFFNRLQVLAHPAVALPLGPPTSSSGISPRSTRTPTEPRRSTRSSTRRSSSSGA